MSGPPRIQRPTFNHRYAAVALLTLAAATMGMAIMAALSWITWDDVANFAVGWGIFALALGWTIDTVRTYRRGERRSPALDELDQRVARGEITVEEYRERRSALNE